MLKLTSSSDPTFSVVPTLIAPTPCPLPSPCALPQPAAQAPYRISRTAACCVLTRVLAWQWEQGDCDLLEARALPYSSLCLQHSSPVVLSRKRAPTDSSFLWVKKHTFPYSEPDSLRGPREAGRAISMSPIPGELYILRGHTHLQFQHRVMTHAITGVLGEVIVGRQGQQPGLEMKAKGWSRSLLFRSLTVSGKDYTDNTTRMSDA